MRFEVVGEAVVEGSNSRCLYLAEGRNDVFIPIPWRQRYIQPESIVLLHLAAVSARRIPCGRCLEDDHHSQIISTTHLLSNS